MRFSPENARVQEDTAGTHLSNLVDDSTQLCPVDSHFANVLLRVRRSPVGHRQTGSQMHRMRGQMPREMQGPAQRRLPAK